MKILIIEPNGSSKFSALQRKATQFNWKIAKLKKEASLTDAILSNYDMIIFGHINRKHINRCIFYNYRRSKKRLKRVVLLYYPEPDNEEYMAPSYLIKYPLGGIYYDLEPAKPEYFRASQEDIVLYTPYLKIYDMTYPSNHREWSEAIAQIEFYLKNGLEPLVDSETLESTVEYYGLDDYLTSTALDSRNYFNKARHRLIEEDIEDF